MNPDQRPVTVVESQALLPEVTEIPTAIMHEREPHCPGCWHIHYRHISFGGSQLSAVCNECSEERPLSIDDSATELDMLREFYDSWQAFHATPKDRLHRHKLERAAQSLVDIRDAIERYRDPLSLSKAP